MGWRRLVATHLLTGNHPRPNKRSFVRGKSALLLAVFRRPWRDGMSFGVGDPATLWLAKVHRPFATANFKPGGRTGSVPQGRFAGQSQGDCLMQPSVDAQRLRWDGTPHQSNYPARVASTAAEQEEPPERRLQSALGERQVAMNAMEPSRSPSCQMHAAFSPFTFPFSPPPRFQNSFFFIRRVKPLVIHPLASHLEF